MFNDASILVTGATGFFGMNFVRYILQHYHPKRVVIYSRDEFKQYLLRQHLQHNCLEFCIGDIRDFPRLEYALRGIDYVVHAASMKHITIAESNPTECIQTNIAGTENLIRACINNRVKKVIGLSTDKAVSPINLYGATKLVLEKLLIAADLMYKDSGTTFSVVRYGNVIGSRGSVLPYFKRIIAEGALELPITHPEMTRFWLPVNDAIKVVIKAFKSGKGGEIFIPKAPSIKIVHLAASLASHLPIKIIGIRKGEKLHEILCTAEDSHVFEEPDYYYIISNNHLPKYANINKNPINAFEYNSQTNDTFLSIKEIESMNQQDEYFIDEKLDLPALKHKRPNFEVVLS